MYILIRKDDKKVLGFVVWVGFSSSEQISDCFSDVAITSFEKNQKAVSVRLFSTPAYAVQESVRIAKELKDRYQKDVVLDIMPLDVYVRQLENWS